MINHLAIIGIGLIGGSLSLALKKADKVKEVVGYARNETTRQEALSLGIIDTAADSIADAVAGADVVVLALPMGAMASALLELAPYVTDKMVITDAGSTKAQVVEDAIAILGDGISQFVPGHPIAGTEKSGPSAAFASLYEDHKVILTPLPQTNLAALKIVKTMWADSGADVSEMTVQHHDLILAATSHLPHLLAFNLMGLLAKSDDVDEVLTYAAGGFRDFSRIASGDPVMWRDICLSNSDAILTVLKQYQQQMSEIEQAIQQQDGDYLMTLFQCAKQARDNRFKTSK
ncbi:MAG: prephenate dehydrogenase [Methylophagaceae bacterium]|jgi:prephenate dehydrogenase